MRRIQRVLLALTGIGFSAVVQANTWYMAPDPRPGSVIEQGVDVASG